MEPHALGQSKKQQMGPPCIHGTILLPVPLTFFAKTADRDARLFPAHDEVWVMLGHDSYLQNTVNSLECQYQRFVKMEGRAI